MTTRLFRALFASALLIALVVPALPSAAAQEYSVHYVETVGGALIRVEIVRDSQFDAQGQPVLLTYSPYNTLGDPMMTDNSLATDGLASRYNPRGIARAFADVLGTRGSTGCWDYGGPAETQSGVDVVNFLSGLKADVDGNTLDWVNGNVGMTGVSYEGTTANMVAAAGDQAPGLKAVIPIAAISHWYGYAYYNGVRYFLNSDSATDEGFDTPLAFDHGFGDTVHTGNPDSITARAAECGAVAHTQQGYSRTPTYTDFWDERDYMPQPEDPADPRNRWTAATLLVHGWNDYNVKQDEAIQLYERLAQLPRDDRETPEVEGLRDLRLWMTQSTHAGGSGTGYQELVDDFWAAYLLEDAEALERLDQIPAMRSMLDNPATSNSEDDVRFDSQWPPSGTAPHELILNRTYEQDVDGVSIPGPGSGEVGELAYESRTSGPLEGRGGAYGPSSGWVDTGTSSEEISQADPWSNDGNPGNANGTPGGFGGQGYYSLAFATGPLNRDVRIAGSAVLDGTFSYLPNAGGVQLAPILVDIDPDGNYRTIERGFLNLDYRNGLDAVAPAPNGWTEARVSFLPEDYIVPEGHRIGLLLQSSNTVWGVPGNPAGFVNVGLGQAGQRPSDPTSTRGTSLILPLVDVAPDEHIYDDLYPGLG